MADIDRICKSRTKVGTSFKFELFDKRFLCKGMIVQDIHILAAMGMKGLIPH